MLNMLNTNQSIRYVKCITFCVKNRLNDKAYLWKYIYFLLVIDIELSLTFEFCFSNAFYWSNICIKMIVHCIEYDICLTVIITFGPNQKHDHSIIWANKSYVWAKHFCMLPEPFWPLIDVNTHVLCLCYLPCNLNSCQVIKENFHYDAINRCGYRPVGS